jgi:hypothetical protein
MMMKKTTIDHIRSIRNDKLQIPLRSCKTTYVNILWLFAPTPSSFPHSQCSKHILPISSLLLSLLSPTSLLHLSSRACINPQLGLFLLSLLQSLYGHRSSPSFWPSGHSSAYGLHTSIVGVQCCVNVCKALMTSTGWCWTRT